MSGSIPLTPFFRNKHRAETFKDLYFYFAFGRLINAVRNTHVTGKEGMDKLLMSMKVQCLAYLFASLINSLPTPSFPFIIKLNKPLFFTATSFYGSSEEYVGHLEVFLAS